MNIYISNMASIITATYNSSHFIEETYKSIRNQTYKNWEWYIVDDYSNDNTLEIITYIAKNDSRVKIEANQENEGAAVSRNKSLAKAQGEFIAFIDSDDLWEERKLERQINFMKKNDVNFSFTAYSVIDEHGRSLSKTVDLDKSGSFSYEDMLRKKATLGCSTVILRFSAFDDMSMPLLRTGQDYALWLKLLRSGNQAYILNVTLSKYRVVSNSISRNKLKKALRQWQIYRKIEYLSFIKSIECFIFYAWRAVFRK